MTVWLYMVVLFYNEFTSVILINLDFNKASLDYNVTSHHHYAVCSLHMNSHVTITYRNTKYMPKMLKMSVKTAVKVYYSVYCQNTRTKLYLSVPR